MSSEAPVAALSTLSHCSHENIGSEVLTEKNEPLGGLRVGETKRSLIFREDAFTMRSPQGDNGLAKAGKKGGEKRKRSIQNLGGSNIEPRNIGEY